MDWTALGLSLRLGVLTVLLLLPVGIVVGRLLAFNRFPGKGFIEALIALPLVLPPTFLAITCWSPLVGTLPSGRAGRLSSGIRWCSASKDCCSLPLFVNLPFAIQPMQRGFEAIPAEVREAGSCSGLSPLNVLLAIDLPLAWPGIVTGLVLAFAHTLGEFGVVLMVGGSIPGETRTIAIAIYDRVQAFDNNAAAIMSALLLSLSLAALGTTFILSRRIGRSHD